MVVDEYMNVSDDRLMNGLIPVVRIMQRAGEVEEESLEIDFSHTKFISPVFALSLIVFLSRCDKHIRLPISMTTWALSALGMVVYVRTKCGRANFWL